MLRSKFRARPFCSFRARNERRVQQGGLRFLWQITDLPPLADFGPHKILQVLRILQEALTNVLKHAGASEVTVRTEIAASIEFSSTAAGSRVRLILPLA